MSHVSAAQQQAHPSVLMQASTRWDVRGGSGGEVFATPTCFPLQEPLLEVLGGAKKVGEEAEGGGGDGNAAANGNILLGLCWSERLDALEEEAVAAVLTLRL